MYVPPLFHYFMSSSILLLIICHSPVLCQRLTSPPRLCLPPINVFSISPDFELGPMLFVSFPIYHHHYLATVVSSDHWWISAQAKTDLLSLICIQIFICLLQCSSTLLFFSPHMLSIHQTDFWAYMMVLQLSIEIFKSQLEPFFFHFLLCDPYTLPFAKPHCSSGCQLDSFTQPIIQQIPMSYILNQAKLGICMECILKYKRIQFNSCKEKKTCRFCPQRIFLFLLFVNVIHLKERNTCVNLIISASSSSLPCWKILWSLGEVIGQIHEDFGKD